MFAKGIITINQLSVSEPVISLESACYKYKSKYCKCYSIDKHPDKWEKKLSFQVKYHLDASQMMFFRNILQGTLKLKDCFFLKMSNRSDKNV